MRWKSTKLFYGLLRWFLLDSQAHVDSYSWDASRCLWGVCIGDQRGRKIFREVIEAVQRFRICSYHNAAS